MSVACRADVTRWCVRTELCSMAFKFGCKCSTPRRRAGASAAWMISTRGHLFVLTQVTEDDLWKTYSITFTPPLCPMPWNFFEKQAGKLEVGKEVSLYDLNLRMIRQMEKPWRILQCDGAIWSKACLTYIFPHKSLHPVQRVVFLQYRCKVLFSQIILLPLIQVWARMLCMTQLNKVTVNYIFFFQAG